MMGFHVIQRFQAFLLEGSGCFLGTTMPILCIFPADDLRACSLVLEVSG